MKSSWKMLFCVAILYSLCGTAGAAALPETGQIVPADTLFLLNIPNFDTLQTQWKKTSYYKLYTDPAMGPFVESFKAKWQQNLLSGNDEFNTIIKDINSMPSGRLAIAFVANDETKKTGEPMLLVISQWGASTAKVKTAIEKAVKRAVDDGAQRTKEGFRGFEIITVTEAAGEKPKSAPLGSDEEIKVISKGTNKSSLAADVSEDENDVKTDGSDEQDQIQAPPSPKKISYCFADDVLVLSEDKEIVKFAVAHATGATGGTLAENGDFTSAIAAVGPAHDIDMFVNFSKVLQIMSADESGAQAQAMIKLMGLDNVTGLGLAMGVGRDQGKPIVARGLLKVSGQKKGILKMLEPQTDAVKVPQFVDASAVGVTVANINLKTAYDELFKLLGGISPGIAAALNTPLVPADQQGQGGVELKKDILDYLAPQIVIAQSLKRPFTAGTDPTSGITAIAITDRKALERSLGLVHSYFSQGKTDMKREFMGHTIYKVGQMPGIGGLMGGMSEMADTMKTPDRQEPGAAFTFTDTYLLVASETNIEQAIRTMNNKQAASVTTTPWFARAKSMVPAKAGIAGFSDDRSSAEFVWWIIKQQAKGEKGASGQFGPATMALDQLKDFADFKLLPDFAVVKKYFGVSSYYLISRPDGFYLESYMLDQK